MIKTYSLDDGSEFQTVILPAGTLLFRGTHSQVYDYGVRGCISPNTQIPFYTAPCFLQSLENYTIHMIYTTNYDVELLLLIKPTATEYSEIQFPSIIKICQDKCEYDMSECDPCFTDKILNNFPQILGYMVGNKRDIIVIHPLHLRRKDEYFLSRESGDTLEVCINSLYMNRANYNFIPLLYITKDNIFTCNDLKKNGFLQNSTSDSITKTCLFEKINLVIHELLTKGYNIDGNKYLAFTDKKTGFYRMKSKMNTRKRYTIHIKISDPDTFATEIFPLHYDKLPNTMTHAKMVEMAESDQGLSTNERVLNSYGLSLSPEYVIDKGNYVKEYRVHTVFPRNELGPYSRYKKNIKTRRKN